MLSRRSLLVAVPGLVLLCPGRARAYSHCTDFDQNFRKTCTVGVDIAGIATVDQRCENWCWAACIQNVFAYYGYDVAQEDVVSKVFGSEICEGAVLGEIIDGINGEWTDAYGRSFHARAKDMKSIAGQLLNPDGSGVNELIRELADGHPLINGAVGHATVLTEVTYTQEKYFNPVVTAVVVRDPWYDSPDYRVLEFPEIVGDFVVKVTVS